MNSVFQDYTTSSQERLLPNTSKGRLTFPSTSHVVHTIDYNPFSSSEEEEEEEQRGRARQKSSRSQDKRRARLATSLTLLLVVFVLVTAVIMGLATSHSSIGGTSTSTPGNTNTSEIVEGRGEVREGEELSDRETGEGVKGEDIDKYPDVEEEDVGETKTEMEYFYNDTY